MLTTLPNRVSALLADPIQTVFREIDRDFPWYGEGSGTLSRKLAPLSMWEDGNRVHIEMDVPGIPFADLDVSLEKGRLTIRGERKTREGTPTRLHDERSFGQFERTVILNEWVDPNSIVATLNDGVLSLTLAKKPESQRQKIAIAYGGRDDAKRIEATK